MKIVSGKFGGLVLLLLAAPVIAVNTRAPAGRAAHVVTRHIDADISLDYPGFRDISIDSLGEEHFTQVTMQPPARPWRPTMAIRRGSRVEYRRPGADDSGPPRWAIEIGPKEITLESHWSASDPPEPLLFGARNGVCHITMLGLFETNGAIQLPAILYFPDQGAFQVSAVSGGIKSVGYAALAPAGHRHPNIVQITFPGATKENPTVKYSWKIVDIHPAVAGVGLKPQFDGFRRDWLNILQLNPDTRALANNDCSTTCAFCYYEYGDIAARTPPLADGLSALGMVRQTLDRIISGGNAYGLAGTDFQSYASDTLPSLLIAAEDYVDGSHDPEWLARNYSQLRLWADEMLATAKAGNGLVQYWLSGNSGSWPEKPKYHPSNWWDTIGFGHEDAYANALAYRALRGMEQIAQQSGHPDDGARYRAAADKLKAAYFNAFYDPATGVLAGWRSADGRLHDYYFLWVNGIAIHYGLVPRDKANEIMDRLLAKMNQVGYTNFALGLPGNLVSVARKDYVDLRLRVGGGTNADNSDGFQIYENGGATGCFSYFTVAALYDLGRIQDGDRILFPLLQAIANGGFEGWSTNGRSKDWKSWDGTGHGYEGFLSDNYYLVLAVLDRQAALEAHASQFRSASGATR